MRYDMLRTVIIFVVVLTCVAAQSDSITWDGVVRQHCMSIPQTETTVQPPSSKRGSSGLAGPPGQVGRPGRPGPPGPIGRSSPFDPIKVKRTFEESLRAVLQRQGNFVLDIPSDYDAKAAYQTSKRVPRYTEWTVFQRRMDGSVNFYRGWDDYVNGFGVKDGEFWLGLENIYQLTNVGYHQVRIDMIEKDGTYLTAKYDWFQIFPADQNYKLVVSSYTGNATDALSYHSHQPFSTFDVERNYCALTGKGAWWYNNCQYSNLNGKYKSRSSKGLRWYDQEQSRNRYMKFVEMKFRRVL